ncbi:MAG TPA: cytochrome c3 family protein, partial [Nannocystis sp.]
MPAIFPRWTNNIPLAVAVLGPFALAGLVGFVWYYFSPKYTDVGYRPIQPVPFSHKLHAGDMGMDCRYCHNTVER